MIRSPLALRLEDDPDRSPRDRWREAATLGVRGLVLDAAGSLAPHRLAETARRDVRQTLRGLDLDLVAIHLPTRRPFDTLDQLDDRLARADQAFELAYALGTRLILVRAGAVPSEDQADRRSILAQALSELGRRAERRGVRLAVEAGGEPAAALAALLDGLDVPSLAASVDPAAFLALGEDPAAAVVALGAHLAHAYATDGAAGPARLRIASRHHAGYGFHPGALDWESYLGSLEEVDYRGHLTLWPDPRGDVAGEARRILEILKRF
jgi:sugar phosphate isomerase/epimerase